MKKMEIVGATFTSGLVKNCDSVPIFINVNGNIHLEIPVDMYIFAYNTNTRDTKRSQKIGRSSGNTEHNKRANRRTPVRRSTGM